jgi:hypothetical protein
VKLKAILILIVVFVVSFSVGGWAAHEQKASGSRIAWEYKEAIWPNNQTLAEIGAQGWELTAIVKDGNGDAHFYFKRAK